MLGAAARIMRKDLSLVLSGGQGILQPLLLGLLLVFLFSLSREIGAVTPPQAAAAIFWLASAFTLVLVANTLYALEEEAGARLGLLLAPAPLAAVWLGKGLAALALLLIAQAAFLPAAVVFLGLNALADPLLCLTAVAAVDVGLAALGSLLGALSQGAAARESLLSLILFPLLAPALLAGIRLMTASFDPAAAEGAGRWLAVALAFDGVFAGAGLVLFPYLYGGEE